MGRRLCIIHRTSFWTKWAALQVSTHERISEVQEKWFYLASKPSQEWWKVVIRMRFRIHISSHFIEEVLSDERPRLSVHRRGKPDSLINFQLKVREKICGPDCGNLYTYSRNLPATIACPCTFTQDQASERATECALSVLSARTILLRASWSGAHCLAENVQRKQPTKQFRGSYIIRDDFKSQVEQCLGFCSADL